MSGSSRCYFYDISVTSTWLFWNFNYKIGTWALSDGFRHTVSREHLFNIHTACCVCSIILMRVFPFKGISSCFKSFRFTGLEILLILNSPFPDNRWPLLSLGSQPCLCAWFSCWVSTKHGSIWRRGLWVTWFFFWTLHSVVFGHWETGAFDTNRNCSLILHIGYFWLVDSSM